MRSRFLTLMMLAALSAACSQQRQPPATQEVDKQVLAEDSREMARRYAQWQASLRAQALKSGDNEKMPLDLSDEVHYRFVMNRLKASGLTALNAPRLFLRLDELHRRLPLPERPMGAPAGVLRATGASASGDGSWCGHMIPLGLISSDALRARFSGTGLTSCFGGSDYGYVDLSAFLTDDDHASFELLANESYEEYAGKVLETAPVSVSVSRQYDRELLVDSLAMAFNEMTGEEQLTYTSVSTTLHPVPAAGEGDLVIEHPRDILEDSPDKAIRLCLERGATGGYLDCDYGLVRAEPDGTWTPFPASGATGIAAVDVAALEASTSSGTPVWTPDPGAYWEPAVKPVDPTRFQIPARGKFVPHVLEECTVTKVTSKVAAILMDAGGWCEAGTAPDTVVGKGQLPWTTPTKPGEYPFNGILDFGTGNCLTHAQNARLEIWVYTEGTCPDPYGGEPEPFRCPSRKVVKPVDYKRGCLAEGTRVTRADGKNVPVQQVKVGEKLLTRGQALTVTSVTRGGESNPLVKLRDEQGGEVRVTETHPMVTLARGVVQAGELKVGDAVLTRTGARKLVAVERVPYGGLVYNFALGTPEELAGQGPEARTLYADGFLVGDSKLQEELEKARLVDSRAVLARLHGAWHQDFQLSQARRHPSARR
ncbi:Hint domain-containing protein [Archangium gephyra]|uniref:Hint domain-containing protein n=1 Tax=Archangium gephyra TaxID=48 RepID=UPI0035D43DF3